jgi:two-component system, sensor histidine kinase and response regulator
MQQLFPGSSLLKTLNNVESYVGVPLLDTQQEVIGNLCLLDVKPFWADE